MFYLKEELQCLFRIFWIQETLNKLIKKCALFVSSDSFSLNAKWCVTNKTIGIA